MANDVQYLIDMLYEMIDGAKGVLMSPDKCIIVREDALDLLDVDKYGLDHNDRMILLTMIEKFQGGPVGLDTLAAAISEDAGTLEDVYEPYLLQNGFIQRTPRGRVVTERAYGHLGIPSPLRNT